MTQIMPPRTDRLFLLIGSNPLPNWVALRLLLASQGQLYFVHSPESYDIAQRLARNCLRQGYKQPIYVSVNDAVSASHVYGAVARQLEQLRAAGSVGLNFTGGTSVMAVHAHRAFRDLVHDVAIYSYLNARDLTMRFETSPSLPNGHPPVDVELKPEVCLSLEQLFNLQDEGSPLTRLSKEPVGLPIARALVDLSQDQPAARSWRRSWTKELERRNSPLQTQPLAQWLEHSQWEPAYRPIVDALVQGRPLEETSLRSLCQDGVWPFRQPPELVNWLSGPWLESYTHAVVDQNSDAFRVHDHANGIYFNFQGYQIEVDTAAVRGYQLFFISCYSGDRTLSVIHKLEETFVRARQIGGDEANAAVVCTTDEAAYIERNISLAMQAEGRARVFGRTDLPNLAEHMDSWFNHR